MSISSPAALKHILSALEDALLYDNALQIACVNSSEFTAHYIVRFIAKADKVAVLQAVDILCKRGKLNKVENATRISQVLEENKYTEEAIKVRKKNRPCLIFQ